MNDPAAVPSAPASPQNRLDLLWGRRPSRRRAGREGLNVERIVAAAVELADAEGLAGVSMSRVAERLGFTTMSLYRHVTSKDELLLLMFDAAATKPPELPLQDGWRAALRHWAVEHRAFCRLHPWLMQVQISGPPMGPNQLGWLDRGLQALAPTPLGEDEKVNIVLLLTVYVMGQARLAEDLRQAGAAAAAAAGPMPDFSELLAPVIDEEAYPALTRALRAGVFDGPDDADLTEDFHYGLERILDGVEARIQATKTR